MKVLSDWMDVGNGLRGRVVELTEEEKASSISAVEFLRALKQDSPGNRALFESKWGK